MDDRELLERAARAAGIVGGEYCETSGGEPCLYISHLAQRVSAEIGFWAPLTDDGDAFRLLMSLPSLWSMKKMFGPYIEVDVAWGTGRGIVAQEPLPDGADRAAAARRAIVRAAAGITERREAAAAMAEKEQG